MAPRVLPLPAADPGVLGVVRDARLWELHTPSQPPSAVPGAANVRVVRSRCGAKAGQEEKIVLKKKEARYNKPMREEVLPLPVASSWWQLLVRPE